MTNSVVLHQPHVSDEKVILAWREYILCENFEHELAGKLLLNAEPITRDILEDFQNRVETAHEAYLAYLDACDAFYKRNRPFWKKLLRRPIDFVHIDAFPNIMREPNPPVVQS